MRKEDIFTSGDRENQEYLAAAIEYTKYLAGKRKMREKELLVPKTKNKKKRIPIIRNIEEERRNRRERYIQYQRQKSLEKLAYTKECLEYVYLAFPDDFVNNVKAVLKKELKHLKKDFEFCMVFPYKNERFEKCKFDKSSIIYIYLKIEDCITIFKLVYYNWKEELEKDRFNFVFQRHYICNSFDIEVPFKDFSEIDMETQVYKVKR